MEVFLQWGESIGCTREEMISFYDAEGNVPLHSAVHSGDFKVILYNQAETNVNAMGCALTFMAVVVSSYILNMSSFLSTS